MLINKAIKLVEACDTKLKEIERLDLNIILKAEQSRDNGQKWC